MKSNKSEQIQVEWLIQQINELDRLIAMHRSGESNFMADQYAARRLNYFKELIGLLTISKFNSTGQETFPLIHALTKENYTRSGLKSVNSSRKNAFERTLEFYRYHTAAHPENSSEEVKPKAPFRQNKKSALPSEAKKVKSAR